jgi:hypothetical protein
MNYLFIRNRMIVEFYEIIQYIPFICHTNMSRIM